MRGRAHGVSATADVAAALSLIDPAPTPSATAAVLGDPPAGLAEALRARGYDVRAALDPDEVGCPEALFDLVVSPGTLGRMPWDRWALQKAHRALKPDGVLVLIAPNFRAASSPGDLAFLCVRAVRELRRRVMRALGGRDPRPRFAPRRYRIASLTATLASLGYEVTTCATRGLGWLAPLGIVGAAVHPFARRHLVRCRRLPSLFGLDPGRPWPEPESHTRAFERSRRGYLEDRGRWLERHPSYRPERVDALDPTAHRDASVLVLAPHPDDELIGCGGTLARLIAAGAQVTVVHATDGSEAASLWHADPAIRRTVRLDEARRVGAFMGFHALEFWKEDNAAFRERDARVDGLRDMLDRLRPTLVFAPFVTDVHEDHRVLSRMLARAIGDARGLPETCRVLNYQVWSLVPPNLYCDITGEAKRQEEALWMYETAMKVDDYVHFCEDRNFYDAITLTGRTGFVEAFYAIPARGYPDLVATGGDADD